jgi:hypothetical protein
LRQVSIVKRRIGPQGQDSHINDTTTAKNSVEIKHLIIQACAGRDTSDYEGPGLGQGPAADGVYGDQLRVWGWAGSTGGWVEHGVWRTEDSFGAVWARSPKR